MVFKVPSYESLRNNPFVVRGALLFAVLSVAAIGTSMQFASHAATPSEGTNVLEGTLLDVHADDFVHKEELHTYTLQTDDKQYIQLDLGGKANPVPNQSRVRVYGQRSANGKSFKVALSAAPSASGVVKSSDITPRIDLINSPSLDQQTRQQSETPSTALTTITKQVLVILVNFAPQDGNTAGLVQQMTVPQANTLLGSYIDSPTEYWSQTSYGSIKIQPTVVGPITISPPTVQEGTDSCPDLYSWSDMADQAATAAGVNLSAYGSHVYFMPTKTCGYPGRGSVAGLGEIGGNRSWLFWTDEDDSYTHMVVAHELGHSFGMLHANAYTCSGDDYYPAAISSNCANQEYGDKYDFMGYGTLKHLNNAHIAQMGALPVEKIQTLSTSGTYTLSSADTDPGSASSPQLIRIPRYAPGQGTSTEYYDLEYRTVQPYFDHFDPNDPVVNGVTIRDEGLAYGGYKDLHILDLTPTTSYGNDEALTVGTFYDQNSQLSVRLVSKTADTVTVEVKMAGNATAPTITGLSKTTSVMAGNAPITITGTGFGTGITATIGGQSATVTRVSDTSMDILTPPNNQGQYDLVVRTSADYRITKAAAITYLGCDASVPYTAANITGVDNIPVNLTVAAQRITWQAAKNGTNGCPVSVYKITRTQGTQTPVTVTPAGGVTTYVSDFVDLTAKPNTAYTYKVIAVDTKNKQHVSAAYAVTTGQVATASKWKLFGGSTVSLGQNGDSPVPGDYDGDGKADIAVYHHATATGNGLFIIKNSSTNKLSYVEEGDPGDTALAKDFDGDGKADPIIFSPSIGLWYKPFSKGYTTGQAGDILVPGDYDGDKRATPGAFHPSTNEWFLFGSPTVVFGQNGDKPVVQDYNGDGKDDLAVYTPSLSRWTVQGATPIVYGKVGDIPVPADYDGDGKADLAVYRPSVHKWFVRGGMSATFGVSGDIPMVGDFTGDHKADFMLYHP